MHLMMKKEKMFFRGLESKIKNWENVILLGDFNVAFTKLDIGNNMVFKTDRGRNELKRLMENFNFIDIWRERNQTRKEYSRRQTVMEDLKQS